MNVDLAAISKLTQPSAARCIAREAMAREIEAEFAGVANARRDALRAADRILSLIERGSQL